MKINEKKQILINVTIGLAIFIMNSSFVCAESYMQSNSIPISTAEFPPFKYADNETGEIVGFDTEIITEVFKSMGLTIEISMMPFTRADILTRKGEYAAYYTFTKNADREKDYYFSEPISSVQDFIFFNKSLNISWEKYEDLKDYRLGYSLKYNYDDKFLNAINKKMSVVYEKNEEYLLKLLKHDRFDMIICEASVCSYLIKKHPKQYADIVSFQKPIGTPEPRPFYIGFSKKWPGAIKLRDDFNIALKKFASDPAKPRKVIFEKYGAQCPPSIFPECE